MLKRLVVALSLAATVGLAVAACSPTSSTSAPAASPGGDVPSEVIPSEAPLDSAEPAAS